jgi:hypothetical protein
MKENCMLQKKKALKCEHESLTKGFYLFLEKEVQNPISTHKLLIINILTREKGDLFIAYGCIKHDLMPIPALEQPQLENSK